MPGVQTVPLQLKSFEDTFKQMFQQGNSSGSLENTANDAIFMAGTLISLIPLLIMYFLLQKQFVEGIDKAGLTGQ
jgi:multiple sugar transport system permease protein